jgi:hypothetical protein
MAPGADTMRKCETPRLLHDWLRQEPALTPSVIAALTRHRTRHGCGVEL